MQYFIFLFSSFFKIFFLVVSFGLFQGLAVLPVLLSIVGPDSQAPDPPEGAASNQNGDVQRDKAEYKDDSVGNATAT